MAEQIPYGVAVSIINKLASLAFREIGRIYGFADELEKLKSTLESIQVVLSDAERRQAEDPVMHWVGRFRQVLHDADDLMDDLAIQDLKRKVEGRSKVRVFFSSDNWCFKRAKLARKIEEIRKKFNDVAGDMAMLNLNSSSVVVRQDEMVWREAGSFVIESEVIGREDDKNKIVELLMQTDENKNVSLVAILGIGGLGKTTLAQFVYNDAEIKRVFQKCIWVCVSEDFEAKTILNKMLKFLKKDVVGDLELAILQQKLREELNGQRYLLVLDDVWNESKSKWEDLRTPLTMCGGEGSMILVTTRNKSVAETMEISNPYVLKGLSEEQSWALLKKATFGEHVGEMSQALVSIGEKVAKKCRGVPLAIKTMGGLLQTHEESEWRSILDGDVWRLCKEDDSIMPVLKLSYRNLPFGLQQCFAYCCLYPKDWEINRAELIQLWMAQGYLGSSDETRSMEDVGNDYVKILLKRSFFQEPFVEYGSITEFKMHDLMHDLATTVAGNDCCLDSEGKGNIGRAMHMCLPRTGVYSKLKSLNGSTPRSILRLQIKDEFLAIPSIKLNLMLLRSLDLSRSSITKLPKFIGKFKHLRYLDLSYCKELTSLPESIENLVLLQTLKLTRCRKLVFSVKVITKLISLRCLYISGCNAFDEKMPAGLRKLTSLQILSEFVVADNAKSKRAALNELKELNLREHLTISNLNKVEDALLESHEANLKGKKHIRSLTLNWRKDYFDHQKRECKNSDSLQLLENLRPHASLRKLQVYWYPGVRFSSWLSSLTNIVAIKLDGFSNCQHLPPLERLPSLESLQIIAMKELKCMHYEEISHVFFPSLKTLSIVDCENLRGWERLGDDNDSNDMHNNLSLPPFPTLSSLNITGCPNLTCMPTFPHLIQSLALRNCSIKPLINTCLVQLEDASFCPLSSLEFLVFGHVTEAETTAKEWMQNLTSLERLHLWGLTLLHHLQHIPSELQKLSISCAVERFDLWKNEGDNGTQYHAPPPGLRSLQTLSIDSCENMKALPEQIGDLKSLRHMKLSYCPKLESLPDSIRCLTNLQTLRIFGCDLLRDRCTAETGQDWPKIAHIPNIDIHES